jgi:fatty-acyl-CoA synthase
MATDAPTANLARIMTWAQRRFPDREALRFEGRAWTYAELDADVHAAAAALRDRGLGLGDRVVVLGPNLPEILVLALALARLGGVLVPLNVRLHEHELVALAQRTRPTGLVAAPACGDAARAISAAVPTLGWRVAIDGPIEVAGGDRTAAEAPAERAGTATAFERWEDFVAPGAGGHVPDAVLGPDVVQRIVFTSGTTSLPKGAMLTHGNVLANMQAQAAELELRGDDRVLNFAPLYHVGGLDLPGFGVWYAGGTMVLVRRFDAARIVELVAQERITGMVMVATMMNRIRRLPPETIGDTSSMRWMIFSQATPALLDDTRQVFPTARLIEGYGMTETCTGLTYMETGTAVAAPGSAGFPLHGVDVRIVDEDGEPLPPGDLGEIVARGPKIFSGYLDDPQATADAFFGEWLRTGDVGRIDEAGRLYVLDRRKDMIRSGGENVASSEIERVVDAIPEVVEVAAIGVPHEKWVEIPVVAIAVREGFDPLRVVEHARATLGRFKQPKAIYVFDELPRNPSGKVLKRDLRDLLPGMEPVWREGEGE